MANNQRVPEALQRGIVALLIAMGIGGGLYVADQAAQNEAARNTYIQAVANDTSVSTAVKVAMVMGSYYESSYRHIGTPYIDKAGRGQPLTVCNGLTGKEVVAGKYYTPADCYRLEKARYIRAERFAKSGLIYWDTYDAFTQATFIDFVWNKGEGAFDGSTMVRLANTGQLQAACQQNERWNKGTVNGVLKVLPGLQTRGNANAAICFGWSPT